MALSEIQQAKSIIDRAPRILLIVPDKASFDAIASMIALYLTLQPVADVNGRIGTDNQGQRLIDEVSPAHVPANLQFLAGSSQVKMAPLQLPELVIDMVGQQVIKNIRQEQAVGSTRIHISLQEGRPFAKEDLEISVRLLPYDAIVVVGAADLEDLGSVFTNNADFFYNTPLINIDHRAANEQFGTVNLVDITAGSCAEVVYELISHLTPGEGKIEPAVATALYAGVVAGTDSFQKPSTTPRSFQVAANLIEQQADRELVIQYLVKTKPLKLIKLAGSVYAHLHYEELALLYWTMLEKNDFLESGATVKDIPAVAHELSKNIAGFNAAFLLYEGEEETSENAGYANRHYHAYVMLGQGLKARRREIQVLLSAVKENGALIFDIDAPSIEMAEKQAHERMKQVLP